MLHQLKNLMISEFGLKNPIFKKINGYDNINYKVVCGDTSYILKTYTYDEELLNILISENEILLQLSEKFNIYPKPILEDILLT